MQKGLVEAEKFQVAVASPPGENNIPVAVIENINNMRAGGDVVEGGLLFTSKQPFMGSNMNNQQWFGEITQSGKTDEDFFQLMCHVEPSLRTKIENGEFVDLEKLLPKDKRSFYKPDEDRLEWVFKDGGTFLAPAGKDNKITGIHKWDQAFRVYAIIYCGAHPERSKEIWQYVEIIHSCSIFPMGKCCYI